MSCFGYDAGALTFDEAFKTDAGKNRDASSQSPNKHLLSHGAELKKNPAMEVAGIYCNVLTSASFEYCMNTSGISVTGFDDIIVC